MLNPDQGADKGPQKSLTCRWNKLSAVLFLLREHLSWPGNESLPMVATVMEAETVKAHPSSGNGKNELQPRNGFIFLFGEKRTREQL